MHKPPRQLKAPLLGCSQIAKAFSQGIVLLAACLFVLWGGLHLGLSEQKARGSTFTCLVVGNVFLALWDSIARMSDMRRLNQRIALAVVAATMAILSTTLYVPPVADLFQMAPPNLGLAFVSFGSGYLACFCWVRT